MASTKLNITAEFDAELSWFETIELRDQAVLDLAALGGVARNILSECVETQGIRRSKTSKAIAALEDAGFVHVRELDGVFSQDISVSPSLWGEEALDIYEQTTQGAKVH